VLTSPLGITKVEAHLTDQLIYIEGTTAPSSIVSAIQSIGRDAILRGSGQANSAGVCILETHAPGITDPVRGLARMVQVSDNTTLVDLTLRGASPGTYHATVRETGDISKGARSTGGIWEAVKTQLAPNPPRGVFGTIQVGDDGRGSAFLDRPVRIWEIIGRSMVVTRQREQPFEQDDPDTLVGVIARSAGSWDSFKTVVSVHFIHLTWLSAPRRELSVGEPNWQEGGLQRVLYWTSIPRDVCGRHELMNRAISAHAAVRRCGRSARNRLKKACYESRGHSVSTGTTAVVTQVVVQGSC